MATDIAPFTEKPSMTVAELVSFTEKELDADAERQAKVTAAGGVGALQGQTGATLDLGHRNIRALPVEVIALIKDKVERLALSHNPQIAVPTQIVQCDRLRYLNIRWNQLKHFPEAVLQLSSLEILDLSKNRIESIPEGIKNMTSLKFLAVARNRIRRLPLALGDMPSLSKLKFDENPIEFPPLDALNTVYNAINSTIETEKEKDVCQQVKRFLKAQSLRQRLRTHSEEDLSESNVETPRPPRRTLTTGRFPVRPSISGLDSLERSPNDAPPIPQRSHARVNSTSNPLARRPGVAPLLAGGSDMNRSRSETLSSQASMKSRRQGLVAPKKRTVLPDDASDLGSARSSSASTLKASETHARSTSTASTLNGFLNPSSGGETSSGAVSPIDGADRYGSSRRLSSLPENRHSTVYHREVAQAGKRLLFIMLQLRGPMEEVGRATKDSTPRRSPIERCLFAANVHVEELDRLLRRLEAEIDENVKTMESTLSSIAIASFAAMKGYGMVVREMRQRTQRIVAQTDAVYLRCLMLQVYMTMVECRNICTILGFKTRPQAPKSTPRISHAWSSRTVTPTQPKPVNNRRMRGATILQSMSSTAELRTMPPPVPMNGLTSRTNTMTSMSSMGAPTPRSGESFSAIPPSAMSSRSNTLRSHITAPPSTYDEDDQFESIYLKLQTASDLSRRLLPSIRTELLHLPSSHHAFVLQKHDAVAAATTHLTNRLRVIKLKDPGIRHQRDFWLLCDDFVKAFSDLASSVREVGLHHRVDVSGVRMAMRPLHKAAKDVSNVILASPLYHQSIGSGVSSGANAFHGFTQMGNGSASAGSGYVTHVPATPLSAALGPAVQATVASSAPPQQEYFSQGTVHGNHGYGRGR